MGTAGRTQDLPMPSDYDGAKAYFFGTSALNPSSPTELELRGKDPSASYSGRFYSKPGSPPTNIVLTSSSEKVGFPFSITSRAELSAAPDFYDWRVVVASDYSKFNSAFLDGLTDAREVDGSWLVDAVAQKVSWRLRELGAYFILRHGRYQDDGTPKSPAGFAIFNRKISEPDTFHVMLRYFNGHTSDVPLKLSSDFLGTAFAKDGAGQLSLRCYDSTAHAEAATNGLLALGYDSGKLKAKVLHTDGEAEDFYDDLHVSADEVREHLEDGPTLMGADDSTLLALSPRKGNALRVRQLAYGVGINQYASEQRPGTFYEIIESVSLGRGWARG